MKFLKRFLSNQYLKFLKNIYVIVSLFFIIWMLFIDVNSYVFHRQLNKEIKELEMRKKTLEEDIQKDMNLLEYLKDDENYEAFARENFFMRKENEDVFIIELQDSIEK
ncbi:MAG: septum formation initiator [Flavobacteriaceae bacterium]|nr:septum formation initiator [Flavobacteriaceae bacterium]